MLKYLYYTIHIYRAVYSLIEYVIVHFLLGRPVSIFFFIKKLNLYLIQSAI